MNATPKTLSPDLLNRMDAYWRAANYLSVGQIYLYDNPLLKRPLAMGDVKRMLLGHWGTTPGQNFIYTHLNRLIKKYDLNMIYVSGPGHGGPAVVSHTYLEGTYSEIYPNISQDEAGLQKLFLQFSFPGGIPSHASPECPGSIHEGGELGYSLSHAYGMAYDNPELIVACVVGDGEAETGPLAAAWHSNKFLNPARAGAVLPILSLTGFKIADPAVLARIPHEDLESLLVGYGYKPYFVEGSVPAAMHRKMAETVERAIDEIRSIQAEARRSRRAALPRRPMIVLRSPKGWTGPRLIDGHKGEGSWRSHQVPFADVRENPAHLKLLEDWLRSYRAEELFDERGTFRADLKRLWPTGARRMSANPHANGGHLRRELRLPDFRRYAVDVRHAGQTTHGNTGPLGEFLRDVMKSNPDSFRIFGPDETASIRLQALYEASKKTWMLETFPDDADGGELSPDGRVMERLSEHTLQGWLEGYVLTGRHGLFHTYEAFAHVIDSMFNQFAKWLDISKNHVSWRAPISSENILLSSTVWRQDHNGFSHQDPGFIDLVANKSPSVTRVSLPPDANTLLAVADHCLRTTACVNVIVADKQPHLQYLSIDEAVDHCAKGMGLWPQASTDAGEEPDVVLACCGDVATHEALAAAAILREGAPGLKLRFVNVVDLFKMQPASEHPHGSTERDFTSLFTADTPVIFNFHGYPWLIHRLSYRFPGHENMHVRGYKEKGNITTPLELAMLNETSRFHLVIDVIDRVPWLRLKGAHLKESMRNAIEANLRVAHETGADSDEINRWTWPY